ncbi:hypothetical protein QQ045_030630 [Rhodiola kirilowii]
MGNSFCRGSIEGHDWLKLISRSGGRRSNFVGNCSGSDAMQHEGIKTIAVANEDHSSGCPFSSGADLCVWIVTWNMNGKVNYKDLEDLVVGGDRRPELIVIGLQEVPRKNILRLLQTALNQTHMLLGKATMQSLQLYVFGRRTSQLFVRELKTDMYELAGCGWLIRRTKGAVAISINYKGVRMIFISCHLSAHARNVEERNNEWRRISRSLFSKNCNPYARSAQVIVWLGDLNYRIHGMDTHPVRDLIRQDLHKLLTANDQLLQEAENGQIFNGYCEGTLDFKPTYKYNVGTSNYDTSYKVRVPSWTDRILFKVADSDDIKATLLSYESIDEINISDHKPVKAHLCFRVNNSSSATS